MTCAILSPLLFVDSLLCDLFWFSYDNLLSYLLINKYFSVSYSFHLTSIKRVFPFATGRLRQNADGCFMLGASNEDVGYNLETSPEVLSRIASHAIRIFPIVNNLQLIRSWASLRVLTPDQKPVYVESEECRGAFAVPRPSGVTLASLHSNHLPEWILDGKKPLDFDVFHSRRFDVP